MPTQLRMRHPRAGRRHEEDHLSLEEADRSAAGRVLDLQRSAGNVAVSRLIQRQQPASAAVPGSPVQIFPPSIVGPPGGSNPLDPSLIPDAVREKVTAFLEGRRDEIRKRKGDGTISFPEVLAMVRQNVPEAQSLQLFQLDMVVRSRLAADSPPERRATRGTEAARAELEAKIANAVTSKEKGVAVKREGGQILVSVAGVKASGSIGPAEVSAEAGPGGLKAEGEARGVKVEVEAGADEFVLKTKAHKVLFDAKLKKDEKTHEWGGTLRLAVALVGAEAAEEVPYAEEVKKAVDEAHTALGEVATHLGRGGKPTDPAVRGKMSEKVKPAVEAIGKVVQSKSDPNVTLAGEVKVGDPQLGAYAGVTLTISF